MKKTGYNSEQGILPAGARFSPKRCCCWSQAARPSTRIKPPRWKFERDQCSVPAI